MAHWNNWPQLSTVASFPPLHYSLTLETMHRNHDFILSSQLFQWWIFTFFLLIKRLWCLSVEWEWQEKDLSSAASWLAKGRRVVAEDNQHFSHKQDKKKVRGFAHILLVKQPTADMGIILAAALMWWRWLFPKLISLILHLFHTL